MRDDSDELVVESNEDAVADGVIDGGGDVGGSEVDVDVDMREEHGNYKHQKISLGG